MMQKARNVLFVMADQLRADCLSCYGSDSVSTPNIDRLAARGTRYTHAYTQSPVCGPSRMSFYTGRYVFSHGATWNFVPLPVGERTMGDIIGAHGIRVAVVGKTHAAADEEGLRRLGLVQDRGAGERVAQAGFEAYARDDGLHPDDRAAADLPYNAYLRAHGMGGANPWHEWANSGIDARGRPASGWYLRNAGLAARVPDEHSESAFTTDRAIDFIREQGDRPWLLHVSYIKPHWPYIVCDPYRERFAGAKLPPPARAAGERKSANPVFRGFQRHPECLAFAQEQPRANALRAYMGLVEQLDHHFGRLIDFLERCGRLDDTLIVFTSDHGDYLGDHWLGEKEFLYEQSVRIPLVVSGPGEPARPGRVCDDLVEAIDLLPTFLDALGLAAPAHLMEGRSLFRRGAWREAAISELDYSIYPAARALRLGPNDARMTMVRTRRWKLMHFGRLSPPQLFDLQEDPGEFTDLADDSGLKPVREELYGRLFDWMASRRNRVAMSDEVAAARPGPGATGGVVIGQW